MGCGPGFLVSGSGTRGSSNKMQAQTGAGAAETAELLKSFGIELAADWGRLVALYPGW